MSGRILRNPTGRNVSRDGSLILSPPDTLDYYPVPTFTGTPATPSFPGVPSTFQADVNPGYVLDPSGNPTGGGVGYNNIYSDTGADVVVSSLSELRTALSDGFAVTLADGSMAMTLGSTDLVHTTISNTGGRLSSGDLIEAGDMIRIGGAYSPMLVFTVASVAGEDTGTCTITLTRKYRVLSADLYYNPGSSTTYDDVWVFKPRRIHIPDGEDYDTTFDPLIIPPNTHLSSTRGNGQGAIIRSDSRWYSKPLGSIGGPMSATKGSYVVTIPESSSGAADGGVLKYDYQFLDDDYRGTTVNIRPGDYFYTFWNSAMQVTPYIVMDVQNAGTALCTVTLDKPWEWDDTEVGEYTPASVTALIDGISITIAAPRTDGGNANSMNFVLMEGAVSEGSETYVWTLVGGVDICTITLAQDSTGYYDQATLQAVLRSCTTGKPTDCTLSEYTVAFAGTLALNTVDLTVTGASFRLAGGLNTYQTFHKQYEDEFFYAGGGSARDMYAVWLDGPGIHISGLNVIGGFPDRGDYTTLSSGILGFDRGNEFENCYITGFELYGIALRNGQGHHVHHCIIDKVRREGYGYGVYVHNTEEYTYQETYYSGDIIFSTTYAVHDGSDVNFTQGSNDIVFTEDAGAGNAGKYKIGGVPFDIQEGDKVVIGSDSQPITGGGVSYFEYNDAYIVSSTPTPSGTSLIITLDRNYPFITNTKTYNDVFIGQLGFYEFLSDKIGVTHVPTAMSETTKPVGFDTIIEYNILQNCRHVVGSSASNSSSYIARYNGVPRHYFLSHIFDRHGAGWDSFIYSNWILNENYQKPESALFGGCDYNPAGLVDIDGNYTGVANDAGLYAFAKDDDDPNRLDINHPEINMTIGTNAFDGFDPGEWIPTNRPTVTISATKSFCVTGANVKFVASGTDPQGYPINAFMWTVSDNPDFMLIDDAGELIYTFETEGVYRVFVQSRNSFGMVSNLASVLVVVSTNLFTGLKDGLMAWWDFESDLLDDHIGGFHFDTYYDGTPSFGSIGSGNGVELVAPPVSTALFPFPYPQMQRARQTALAFGDDDFTICGWLLRTEQNAWAWVYNSGIGAYNWQVYTAKYVDTMFFAGAEDLTAESGVQIRYRIDSNPTNDGQLWISMCDGMNEHAHTSAAAVVEVGVPVFWAITCDRDGNIISYYGKAGTLNVITSEASTLSRHIYTELFPIRMGDVDYRGGVIQNRLGVWNRVLSPTELQSLLSGKDYTDL